jgi:hypothetical protein
LGVVALAAVQILPHIQLELSVVIPSFLLLHLMVVGAVAVTLDKMQHLAGLVGEGIGIAALEALVIHHPHHRAKVIMVGMALMMAPVILAAAVVAQVLMELMLLLLLQVTVAMGLLRLFQVRL